MSLSLCNVLLVPDLSTTEHIERTLTSKLQEVKGAVTEQWKQLQVNNSCHVFLLH